MTSPTTKTDRPGSTAILLLDNILLISCIAVLTLRATFTEAPTPQSTQIQAALDETTYSLCLSAVLIFGLLIRLLVNLWAGSFSYRRTAMEIGLLILLAAALVSSLAAPDKRAAITSAVTLLSPLFMAILLVRLLDSGAKIKIMLIAIVALGIVAAWQSAEQFFVSNRMMIEQYRDDPNAILQPLGIQPGTLNQMLLEHRIYSEDVRASFTTSNSAGSFAILASFAAIALVAERLKALKSQPVPAGNLVFAALAVAGVLFGLFITRSKGAVGAFALGAAIFAVLLLLKTKPKTPKIILLAACLTVAVLVPVVTRYGLKHDRLPGGNSMLVRWQYWRASVQMLADHPFTGVGPGNFAEIYHRYKPPAAPETVSDPHCFVLGLLTQYGPLGLIGFLAIVLPPLWRTSSSSFQSFESRAGPPFAVLAVASAAAAVAVMLVLRPFLMPQSTAESLDEKLYIAFSVYAAPAVACAIGYWLLGRLLQTGRKGEYATGNSFITAAALFAAVVGVLIHNLVDFAIFEPGVFTAFCAALACLAALNSAAPAQRAGAAAGLPLKLAATALVVVLGFMYLKYALLPVSAAAAKMARTRSSVELGQVELAHNLLEAAGDEDPFSPDAPAADGRLWLEQARFHQEQRAQLLSQAEQALFTAVERNPADYRTFETLAEVYSLFAHAQPDKKDEHLKKALESARIAVELYPGDAEMHIQLAQIAEQLSQTDVALKHFQQAVRIEDGFRRQFHVMYPDREVFSRLPNEKYLLAKERANVLSEPLQPKE